MDATKKVEILRHLETEVFPRLSPVAGTPNRKPLSLSERLEKARTTLENDPSLFLEKYGSHLRLDDLAAFEVMKGDYEVNYYVERLSLLLGSSSSPKEARSSVRNVAESPIANMAPSHKQIQNRRLRYLQLRLENTEYFSDDELRARDPRLYKFYVGRHVPDSERFRPFSDDVTLVQRIFQGMDNQRATEVLEQLEAQGREVEEEEEEEAEQEEEQEEVVERDSVKTEGDGSNREGWEEKGTKHFKEEIGVEEREALREELLKLMKERFLSGKDNDFDYSQCDFNAEYDDIVQMQQDAEDAYFDSMDVEEPDNEGVSPSSVLGPNEYDY